jgi:hypothetical protein
LTALTLVFFLGKSKCFCGLFIPAGVEEWRTSN